jgi:hypothetical protein
VVEFYAFSLSVTEQTEESGYIQDPVAFFLREISIPAPTASWRGQLPVTEAMNVAETSPEISAICKWH